MKNKTLFSLLALSLIFVTASNAASLDASELDLSKARIVKEPKRGSPIESNLKPVFVTPTLRNAQAQMEKQKSVISATQTMADAPDSYQLQVRIENQELLAAIDQKGTLTLLGNGLATKDRAVFRIMDEGSGLFCQTLNAAVFKNGETLTLLREEAVVHETDPTFSMFAQVYGAEDGRRLALSCIQRGDLETDAVLEKNFETILTFSDRKGNWKETKAEGAPKAQIDIKDLAK